MGEIQEKGSSEQSQASVQDAGQASLVVGKIPPGQGLWGALEQVRACDAIRNGVLVVFSAQSSGRFGVFCNSHITGAVVDSTGVVGSKAIQALLAVTSGMFCFRPCFGDETTELGQQIALSIRDLLDLREGGDAPENPATSLSRIPAADIEQALGEDFLGDIEESPVESALVVTTSSSKASTPAPPESSESKDGDDGDYFDWLGQATTKTESPNLRKILLPVMNTRNNGADQSAQISHDLTLYKQVLQLEEERIRKDIEKTKEKAGSDNAAKQTLDDMNLLAGMLQQQEQMISQKWQGLDEIPTPRANEIAEDQSRQVNAEAGGPAIVDLTWQHLDSTGQMHSGSPLRSAKEFLAGCEDLVSSQIRPAVGQNYFRKAKGDSSGIATPIWLSHPVLVGLAIVALFGLIAVVMSKQMTGSAVRASLKEGQAQIRAQHWSEAIVSYNDAIIKDPNCSQAYFYRGIALEESGDEDGAQSDFKAAKAHGTPAADIAVAQAGIDLRKEAWQQAIDVCNQAITAGARSAAVYRLRANANLHLGAFKDAKADCESALLACKNDPAQHAQIQAERGYARIALGDFDGGASDFDAALKDHPDKGLYMLKGDAYRKVKRFADAVENYNHALDIDARSYDAYVARGICEVGLSEKTQALKDFGRALELNPNGVEALIQRGSLALSEGAYRMALDDLQTAWDLNPTIEEARQKLAMAYAHSQKEIPKNLLLADRRSDRRKLPSDPKQLVIIGYNYLNQNDLDSAVDVLIEAVKKDPNNANARRYLAYSFSRSGNFAAASSQFKALSSLQTLTAEETLTYGKALEHSGNTKAAVELLSYALSRNQDSVPLRVQLAHVYYGAGRKTEGDQLAQDGLARSTSDSDRNQFLDVLKNAGQPTAAPYVPTVPGEHIGTHG